MRQLLRIIFSTLFLIHGTYSFSTNTDSLLVEWRNRELPDSNRVKAAQILVNFYSIEWNENQKNIETFAHEVIQAGKDEKKPRFKAYGYTFMATASNDREGLIYNLEKALPIIVEHKMSDISTGALMNLGNFSKWSGNYQKAMGYYYQLLGLPETADKIKLQAELHYQLAEIYLLQKDTSSSISKIEAIFDLEKNKGLNYRGVTHTNSAREFLGLIYLAQNKFDLAQNLFLDGLNKAEFNNHIANAYLNLCKLKVAQGDIDSALYYISQSEIIFERMENKYKRKKQQEVDIAYHYALCYFHKKDYQTALKRATYANKIANIALFVERKKDISFLLYEIYKIRNDHKNALAFHEQYTSIKDSLVNESNIKELTQLEMKHEYNRKELNRKQQEKEAKRKEIEKQKILEDQLARRDNLQYSGIVIFVFVLFMLVFALGKFNISNKIIEGITFFMFLLVFEFILLFIDPIIAKHIYNAPLLILAVNAGIAILITPIHQILEDKVKAQYIN